MKCMFKLGSHKSAAIANPVAIIKLINLGLPQSSGVYFAQRGAADCRAQTAHLLVPAPSLIWCNQWEVYALAVIMRSLRSLK